MWDNADASPIDDLSAWSALIWDAAPRPPSSLIVSPVVAYEYDWLMRRTRIEVDWSRALFPVTDALKRWRVRLRWWWKERRGTIDYW